MTASPSSFHQEAAHAEAGQKYTAIIEDTFIEHCDSRDTYLYTVSVQSRINIADLNNTWVERGKFIKKLLYIVDYSSHFPNYFSSDNGAFEFI